MNKSAPVIAIYFSDEDPYGYPFNNPHVGKQYLDVYRDVIQELKDRAGIVAYMVRGNSYLGEGRFKSGFVFAGRGEIVPFAEEIQADLIFNRDDKNTIPYIDDCKVVNHPDFDQLCVDKLMTAKTFPNLSPRTAELGSFAEFEANIVNFVDADSNLVVLKDNFDAAGRGISILPANEVKEDLYEDWSNVLMQEFLDSSCGIPNVVEGMHDLRVTVVDGQPSNSFLRMPAEGSYLANISQGGSGHEMELEDVPAEIMEMVGEVIAYANAKYKPYLFSADFMRTNRGYRLIELNSRPGLLHPDFVKNWRPFNEMVIAMLIEAVKSV